MFNCTCRGCDCCSCCTDMHRRCYCPRSRWGRWRDGVIAGPDKVVGTPDDVEVPEE